MPRYFDIEKAKRENPNITDAQMQQFMKDNNLQPMPSSSGMDISSKDIFNNVDSNKTYQYSATGNSENKDNFIKRVGKNLYETAVGLPKLLLATGEAAIDKKKISKLEKQLEEVRKKPLTEERVAEEEKIANEMNRVAGINEHLMSQEDVNAVSGNVGKGILYGAKKGAGTASFVVPGGGGTAASVGGRIATAAARGALAGGMAGFSQDTEDLSLDESLKNATTGALTGGATGAVFQTGGEMFRGAKNLLKLGKEKGGKVLSTKGKDLEVSARAKSIGMKPAKRYGGAKLFDQMDEVGITGNNVEDLASSADQILKQNTDDLINGVNSAAGGKLEVSTKPLISKLKSELADAPAAKKPIYERILKEVDEDLGGKTTMKFTDFFKLKQKYGAMGKWTPGSFFDDTSAGVYEGLYVNMNDIADEALKATGNATFRANNKAITTAIKALRYADDASMKVANQGINLYDIIAGASGFSFGGGAGGLTAMAGGKLARSPAAQRVVGKAMQKAGSGLTEKATQEVAPSVLSKIPQLSTPSVVTQSMVNTPQPTVSQTQPSQGMDITSQDMFSNEPTETTPVTGHTVDEYLKAISRATAAGDKNAVTYLKSQMEIEKQYEGRGTKAETKLTDKQRSYAGAGKIGQEIIDIMETSPDKTNVGVISGRLSKIGEVLGTESKEQTEIKSKIASARTAARNALLGANMSDEELESYLDATFDIRLPRKVLLNRLKTFVSDMETLSMMDTSTPESINFSNGSSAF